ncbi:MAG: hypothetical protein ACOC4K_00765 [Verrucomicrobiota bacterium]
MKSITKKQILIFAAGALVGHMLSKKLGTMPLVANIPLIGESDIDRERRMREVA